MVAAGADPSGLRIDFSSSPTRRPEKARANRHFPLIHPTIWRTNGGGKDLLAMLAAVPQPQVPLA